ncbi:hypothetical protein BD770DRAFT_445240 [Pilaira anomala]|nr:hypothetical protein BD770DRAFT_445240 [Pilaira anomala]
MSRPNNSATSNSSTTLNYRCSSPVSEVRDPIMEDNRFSLRFGNPINVIHNTPKHQVDSFEPTKEHIPGSVIEAIGDTLNEKKQRAPLTKNNSSYLRDATLYSEYVHNKDGSITEIDHDK